MAQHGHWERVLSFSFLTAKRPPRRGFGPQRREIGRRHQRALNAFRFRSIQNQRPPRISRQSLKRLAIAIGGEFRIRKRAVRAATHFT